MYRYGMYRYGIFGNRKQVDLNGNLWINGNRFIN